VGEFWQTTLTAIRRGEADWRAITAYEAPVRRFLARRCPELPEAERDDLVQEVLIAMRERLVPGYDPGAGSFRAFLQTAITNRLRDHLRRRRRARAAHDEVEPDTLEGDGRLAPSDAEVDALDLEAAIVGAVRAVHDRHAAARDLELVYVLSGVLVHGLSNKEVARREGLSTDQVKRRLQQAREEVLVEVFRALAPGAPQPRLARAADLARAVLRAPRQAERLLEAEPDAAPRELVRSFTSRLRDARTLLDGPAGGEDLLRGVQAIFDA
jgi:RNA polymerase sigma factor (sigma-70 family)